MYVLLVSSNIILANVAFQQVKNFSKLIRASISAFIYEICLFRPVSDECDLNIKKATSVILSPTAFFYGDW